MDSRVPSIVFGLLMVYYQRGGGVYVYIEELHACFVFRGADDVLCREDWIHQIFYVTLELLLCLFVEVLTFLVLLL